MDNIEKINPLNAEDTELISDFDSIYDLGTKTIIGIYSDKKLMISQT